MEISEEVRPVFIKYICDTCGEGEMAFKGIVLTSYPAQYPHSCIKCGQEQTFFKQYPTLEYRKY
jgi:hypothetical protein